MRLIFLGVLVALLFVAGCQPAYEVVDGQLYLFTEDGEKLTATYYDAPNAFASLILVHDSSTTRRDWDRFAQTLQGLGISSLAFDMRGFGNSSGTRDYAKSETYDLAAAEKFLREEGNQNISLVGSNVGANIGLRYAAYHSSAIKKVFLISPHWEWENVLIDSDVLEAYAPGELYLYVSKVNDPYWEETVKIKNKYTGGYKKLRLFVGEGDGFDLLNYRFDAIAGNTYAWQVRIPQSKDSD